MEEPNKRFQHLNKSNVSNAKIDNVGYHGFLQIGLAGFRDILAQRPGQALVSPRLLARVSLIEHSRRHVRNQLTCDQLGCVVAVGTQL